MTTQTQHPRLLALLDGLQEKDLPAMQKAVDNQLFFVDAIACFNGSFSCGSIECGDVDLPAVYATKEEAIADIEDMQSSYAQQIEEGERDSDDDYEGELLAVRWDGGDNITFLNPDSLSVIQTQTLADACGW